MDVQDDVTEQQSAARQLEWRGCRDGFYISTVGDVANHGDVEYVIGEVPLQLGFGVPFRAPLGVRFGNRFRYRFGNRRFPRPRTLNRYRFRFGTPIWRIGQVEMSRGMWR